MGRLVGGWGLGRLPVGAKKLQQHALRRNYILEGSYTLPLWNKVPKDHPYYGFGGLIP